MGLSKEQVERHIAGVEKRLGSAQERAHHGYEFARLCVEVQKHSEAIKYLSEYLCVQEKDFRYMVVCFTPCFVVVFVML
jgi:hypothetical protein